MRPPSSVRPRGSGDPGFAAKLGSRFRGNERGDTSTPNNCDLETGRHNNDQGLLSTLAASAIRWNLTMLSCINCSNSAGVVMVNVAPAVSTLCLTAALPDIVTRP